VPNLQEVVLRVCPTREEAVLQLQEVVLRNRVKEEATLILSAEEFAVFPQMLLTIREPRLGRGSEHQQG
jgi:hypothetical protein